MDDGQKIRNILAGVRESGDPLIDVCAAAVRYKRYAIRWSVIAAGFAVLAAWGWLR